MNQNKNSKEITYSVHNIKSYLKGVKKVYMKRKSDDGTSGSKLCLYKPNSNSETTDTNNIISSNIPKEKKICIKFKDFVAEEEGNNIDDNLELALSIKKRRYTNNPKKIYKCNNKIKLENEKEKEETNNKKIKNSKSMGKIIIGNNNKENTFFYKFKKKFFCWC